MTVLNRHEKFPLLPARGETDAATGVKKPFRREFVEGPIRFPPATSPFPQVAYSPSINQFEGRTFTVPPSANVNNTMTIGAIPAMRHHDLGAVVDVSTSGASGRILVLDLSYFTLFDDANLLPTNSAKTLLYGKIPMRLANSPFDRYGVGDWNSNTSCIPRFRFEFLSTVNPNHARLVSCGFHTAPWTWLFPVETKPPGGSSPINVTLHTCRPINQIDGYATGPGQVCGRFKWVQTAAPFEAAPRPFIRAMGYRAKIGISRLPATLRVTTVSPTTGTVTAGMYRSVVNGAAFLPGAGYGSSETQNSEEVEVSWLGNIKQKSIPAGSSARTFIFTESDLRNLGPNQIPNPDYSDNLMFAIGLDASSIVGQTSEFLSTVALDDIQFSG